MRRYLRPEDLEKLARASVGVAGVGGLGSNASLFLARSGVERMLLADFDVVEPSNLNRQQYWPRHVGKKKVEALKETLLELNPRMEIEIFTEPLSAENLPEIIARRPVWIEAFDDASLKSQFVHIAASRADFVVAASGLCGVGGEPMKKKRLGNLVLVGDFVTGLDAAPPFAPRVAQAAALMADCALEFILRGRGVAPFEDKSH